MFNKQAQETQSMLITQTLDSAGNRTLGPLIAYLSLITTRPTKQSSSRSAHGLCSATQFWPAAAALTSPIAGSHTHIHRTQRIPYIDQRQNSIPHLNNRIKHVRCERCVTNVVTCHLKFGPVDRFNFYKIITSATKQSTITAKLATEPNVRTDSATRQPYDGT